MHKQRHLGVLAFLVQSVCKVSEATPRVVVETGTEAGGTDGATPHRRPQSSRDHHGSVGRDDHARTIGGARQQDRAPLENRRPKKRRPLRRLYGEPPPLHRVRFRRRTSGSLLHQRQFLSDGRRARLYRQQQPIPGPHHVAVASRGRARGAARLPPCKALPGGRWARRWRRRPQSR